jgi:hypothetical protein
VYAVERASFTGIGSGSGAVGDEVGMGVSALNHHFGPLLLLKGLDGVEKTVVVKVTVACSCSSQPFSIMDEHLSNVVFVCRSSVFRLVRYMNRMTHDTAGTVQVMNHSIFINRPPCEGVSADVEVRTIVIATLG